MMMKRNFLEIAGAVAFAPHTQMFRNEGSNIAAWSPLDSFGRGTGMIKIQGLLQHSFNLALELFII